MCSCLACSSVSCPSSSQDQARGCNIGFFLYHIFTLARAHLCVAVALNINLLVVGFVPHDNLGQQPPGMPNLSSHLASNLELNLYPYSGRGECITFCCLLGYSRRVRFCRGGRAEVELGSWRTAFWKVSFYGKI